MSTLYDLFKVSENASQAEIKKAFDKIIEESTNVPQDEETVKNIRRLKIAYGILSNPQKRKDYDLNLAEKRANELIKKIEVKNAETVILEKDDKKMETSPKIYTAKQMSNKINLEKNIRQKSIDTEIEKEANKLSQKKLQQDIKKQKREEARRIKSQKREYKKEKRLERKEKQQKREMEIQAYGNFLEQQGYKVKYPWTWTRVKRLLISILLICISLVITWNIPPINKALKNLYNDNIIIQKLVDIFFSTFEMLINTIKEIFVKS